MLCKLLSIKLRGLPRKSSDDAADALSTLINLNGEPPDGNVEVRNDKTLASHDCLLDVGCHLSIEEDLVVFITQFRQIGAGTI